MPASTIYDVDINYRLRTNNARQQLNRLDKAVMSSSRNLRIMSTLLRGFAAIRMGQVAFRSIKENLIDYNTKIETANNTMGALIMMNKGWDPEKSFGAASTFVNQMREDAAQAIGTFDDFLEMSELITASVTGAGASMAELRDLTRGATVASQAMGIRSDVAARDIESMVMGNVRSVDRFARILLNPLGFEGEEGRKRWNQMSQRKRLEMTMQAVTSPAIKQLEQRFADSFLGQAGALEENIKSFFGAIGKSLMPALTAQFKKWNEWFKQNKVFVQTMARDLGTKLKNTFDAIMKAVAFIVDHKDALIAIATAYGAIKVGQFATGAIQTGAGLLGAARGGGVAGMAGGSLGRTMIGALSAVPGAMPIALTLATLEVGTLIAENMLDKKQAAIVNEPFGEVIQEEMVQMNRHLNLITKLVEGSPEQWVTGGKKSAEMHAAEATRLALRTSMAAFGAGILTKQRATGSPLDLPEEQLPITALKVNEEKFRQWIKSTNLTGDAMEQVQIAIRNLEGNTDLVNALNRIQSNDAAFIELQKAAEEKEKGRDKPPTMNGDVVINLKTEDPDAFAFALASSFEDFIKAPNQVQTTIPRRTK